jgi:hypothetical protein
MEAAARGAGAPESDPGERPERAGRRALGRLPGTCATALTLGIASALALASSPVAHAQQEITWKVVNRFPLLREAEDLDALATKRDAYLARPDQRNPEDRIRPTRWDAFEQRYERALIDGPVTVRLALQSAPRGSTCIWSVDGVQVKGAACSGFTVDLPWTKREASVEAEVENGPGSGPSSRRSQTIRVRSLLVVSLGDSYSSGEGVPDLDFARAQAPALADRNGNALPRPAIWWDQRCHRSLNSAPAQAAMDLARRNDHVQVVFVSFACSGAEIDRGLLAPYAGMETYAQLVEQLRTYLPNALGFASNRAGGCRPFAATAHRERDCAQAGRCQRPEPDPTDPVDCSRVQGVDHPGGEIGECAALCVAAATGLQHNAATYVGALPSQLNALLDLLCDTGSGPDELLALRLRDCARLRRSVDALVLSIGANDVGFGPLVRNLVAHDNAFNLPGFGLRVQRETALLSERFEALDHALRRHVAAKQDGQLEVFISQYPDLTQYDGSDDRCGIRDKIIRLEQRSFSSWWLDLVSLGVSENEIGDARAFMIEPLKRQVLFAAGQNGWTLVDGHLDAFKGHGYCHRWTDGDRLPWTHNHGDSLARQGWLANAYDQTARYSSGAMHPNILGQRCHARALDAALARKLLGQTTPEGVCNTRRSYD